MTRILVVVPFPADGAALDRTLRSLPAAGGVAIRVVAIVDPADMATGVAVAPASGRRLAVVERARAAGWARAVDEAIMLGPDEDVLLLEGGCTLPVDGLERLGRHAGRERQVALVVPLAAHDGVADGDAPLDGVDDALCREANDGVAVVVPLAFGPCAYLARSCLAALGGFAADAGAGPHSALLEFSARATKAGWLALLAGDVLVAGEGAADRADRPGETMGRLVALHPDLPDRLDMLARRNPARILLARLALARVARGGRPLLLFVTHRWGGGIRRHVEELARLVAPIADTLLLDAAGGGVVRLSLRTGRPALELFFRLPDDTDALVTLLGALPLARLHFHHVEGLPRQVLDLPARLGVPHDFTLHDYYPVCPQYHLLDADGRYCGDETAETCRTCLATRPSQWGLDVAQWRAAFRPVLAAAQRVIAPSHDVATRLQRYFPELRPVVWPNPEPAFHVAAPAVRVALLGTLSNAKGLRVLAACAADARERGLPLAFRVIGATTEPVAQFPAAPVTVTGEYAERDLAALLAAERPDVLFFPAQAPETYSYTLTAAMATGLPIVASRLGALTERLAGYAAATLLPPDAAVGAWNDALIAAGHAALVLATSATASARDGRGTDPARYAEAYIAPLVARAPATALDLALPLAAAHALPPEGTPAAAELPLPTLYAAGVDSGQREARAELQRRLPLAERELGELREWHASTAADRSHLEAKVAELQRELTDATARSDALLAATRERIAALESSTSWRVTAPMRRAVQSARVAKARWRATLMGIRHLPRRVQIATSVLKYEGPAALATRVRDKLAGRRGFKPRIAPHYAQATAIGPLVLPTVETPRVSIVIPVYGNPILTYTCLASIAANTPSGAYEVIVVDDASPDPAADALRAVAGLRIVRNERNLGFVGTCNRGADEARGALLVLLNNDTIVTPGWLEALEAVFAAQPEAGLVGAKLVYPDGRLQEAGGIVWRDGSAWNCGRDDDPDKPEYNYVREVDYCSGACLAIPAALFRGLGGFDLRYAPAYFEDVDLAFAVRKAGRRVYYQPAATVVHFEGLTAGTETGSGVKRHQVVNQATFRDKWGAAIDRHRANGVAPALERDRTARQRVLFIEACMLTPDHDAGSVRTLALLELLVGLRCKVTFVADNLEHREPYVSALQQRGIEVLFAPYVRSVSDVLAARGGEFDVVIVARHYILTKHLATIRSFAPQALLAFDTVDLHFLRAERQAELESSAIARASARARRDEELALIRRVDVTIVVSTVEREVLGNLAPEARVMLITLIQEPVTPGRPFAEREGLVFIGGFQHPPNADAVHWYASEILPHVRELLPGVKSIIVGSKVPPTIQALAADDFVVAGYVPDIEPYFTGCRVSIAPLRYGAGAKGKINLAMAYGLPVVGTSSAAEGMQLKPGEDVMVADSPRAFAEAVARVYRDEALWVRLAAGGTANLRNHFSRAVARSALERLLALAEARRRASAPSRTPARV